MADEDVAAPSLDHGPNPALAAQEGTEQLGWSQPEFTHGVSPYYAGEPPPRVKAAKAEARAEPAQAEAAPEQAEVRDKPDKAADHRSAGGRAGHRA